MSQQVNSSTPLVQEAARPQSAPPVADTAAAVQPPLTQLDRIDGLLAVQRAQQVQLDQALSAAKTGTANRTQTHTNTPWVIPALGENAGFFAASGLAAMLLCAGFIVVWRGRYARPAAPLPAVHSTMSDSMSMASDDNAQPWNLPPNQGATAQPTRSDTTELTNGEDSHNGNVDIDLDLDFDMNAPTITWSDSAVPSAETTSDFVSDEVRKVQQSLADKRAARKNQQRALQPQVLLEMDKPAPKPLPEPIAFPAVLTDEDAQWTVQLRLAQEMADLGQVEDAQALCQEVFIKGSENMQGVALQIMTRLPSFKPL